MLRQIAAAFLLFTAATAAAQTPPKLLVVISVDQLSADLFAEYRPHWTGGMKRLSGGAVFPSGYQSHAATETCPGHSTILTGIRPARNGIVANNWIDQSVPRADKTVYCAEDERVPGSSSSKYTASAVHLLVPTLGERMRAANPQTRLVSVAGKDRAAIMMGGHAVDQLWYWTGKGFEGSAIGAPAAAVAKANAAVTAAIARPVKQMKLSPLCASRSRPVAVGTGRTLGTGRFERKADDSRGFRASPEFDEATLALAGDLAAEMRLGKRDAVDVLSVGLSATDYVGHSVGTGGSEMCIQLEALDTVLGAFFKRLDAARIDYAAVLTADHGGHDMPERNRDLALAGAARVDPALAPKAIGATIARELGLGGAVLMGDTAGDIWLDRALPGNRRAVVLARAKALYAGHPQVAAAFTGEEIAATPIATTPPETWSLIERARASFVAGRSGDLIVMLKPRITPIPEPGAGYVATHGSPWDYDRRVPILFWRKGMVPFEQPNGIETIDIAPTLAALIGFPVAPGEMDGVCRDLDAGTATTCR